MTLFLLILLHVCLGEKLLDLSHDLAIDSMRWPTMPPFTINATNTGYQEGGFWLENFHLSFGEHITTHMDAPSHFSEDGYSVDEIPIENLIGPAIVIDISEKVVKNSLATLNATDVSQWIEKHGVIPNNSIVFVRTGWGVRYGDKLRYFGMKNESDTLNLSFPGIGVDAAMIFTGYESKTGNRVVGVGIDTASMDPGDSQFFDTHVELYTNNIYGLENVANLEKLPITGAEVTVMPIKTRGGSGGPCRITARIKTGGDVMVQKVLS